MLKRVLLATTIALGFAIPVQAQTDLRAASTFGPRHLHGQEVFPLLIDKIEELTDGRYTATDHASGLVSPFESHTALRDGIVQMTILLTPYFPTYFPESAMTNELGIANSNAWVMAAASTEYIVTCEECQSEFEAARAVYLGGGATQPYQILSRGGAIESLEDLQGLRMRTLGGPFAAWAESLGVQTVQAPSTEVFELLNQGTIDAVHISLPELTNFQLYDVVESITMTNLGLNLADCTPCLSASVWSDMNATDRKAMVLASEYAQHVAVGGWERLADEARTRAEESGIQFVEPSADLLAMNEEFLQTYLAALPSRLTERGIADAEQKLDRLLALIEKWEGLFDNIDTSDRDAVVDLRMQEIWDKVDFDTYGG